jgi:endoglucanase
LYSPGTDVAAMTSAAFSSCALLYGNRSLGTSASLANATYSSTLLTHSKQLMSFAANGTMKTYTDSLKAIKGSGYDSDSFADDLVMAGIFLSMVDSTESAGYFKQAENWYNDYHLDGKDVVFNWASKTPSLALLFAQALTVNTGLKDAARNGINSWKQEAEKYFDHIVDGKAGSKTPGS